MSRIWIVPLFLTLALPLAAQQPASPAAMDDASMDAVRPLYGMVKGYLVRSAEQMPAEKYDYRPTEEVRSFGQIVGHAANSQYMFCAAARGEEAPTEQDAEKLTTKDELVEALKASFAYCDDAYANLTPDQLAQPLELFGMKNNRLFALVFNVAHDFEHYGNLVTYFRLNGMVPPSSQRGQ